MKPIDYFKSIPYLIAFTAFAVCVWLDFSWYDFDILPAKSEDEFAFHISLLRMYNGMKNLNLQQFFYYSFYSYGFPFFLLNLIATIPFLNETGNPYAIIIPRIITSSFFLFSLLMIVKIIRSEKHSKPLTASSLIIILLMPGIWANATWFHPDFMMTFLILLTFWLIKKSELKENQFYWFSVAAWGMAIAIKIQAITLAPSFIWLYLGWMIQGRSMSSLLKILIKTTGIIVVVFIITNPYIIHPLGMQAWLSDLMANMHSNATNHGFGTTLSLSYKLNNAVFNYYFPLSLFVLTILSALYLVIIDVITKSISSYGILSFYILTNYSYNLFFINKAWNHYYLPIAFVSALVIILAISNFLIDSAKEKHYKSALLVIISSVLSIQLFTYQEILVNIIKVRFNGKSHSTRNHKTIASKNELEEKNKSIKIAKLLNGISASNSYFIISPVLNFPFKETNINYENVRVAYSPIHQEIIKEIKTNNRKIYILLRKDDIYFNQNTLSKMPDFLIYKISRDMIINGINGHGSLELIKENEYCYLFSIRKKLDVLKKAMDGQGK